MKDRGEEPMTGGARRSVTQAVDATTSAVSTPVDSEASSSPRASSGPGAYEGRRADESAAATPLPIRKDGGTPGPDESGHGRDVAAQARPPLSPSPSSDSGGSVRGSPELFSVRADLHPPCTDQDLADWTADMKCAFAELYMDTLTPIPTDPRAAATVLRRRAATAAEYARFARMAAFVADRLADQELAGLLDETQEDTDDR